MSTTTPRAICDRSVVLRIMIVMTTFAMLGCRRAGNRASSRSIVAALAPRTANTHPRTHTHPVRLWSSRQGEYDDSGRRVRRSRPASSGGWGDDDDDDDWGQSPSPSSSRGSRRTSNSNSDSWDDFDPWDDSRQQQQQRPQRRQRDDYRNNDDDWDASRNRQTPRRQRYNDFDDDDDDFGGDDGWDAAPRRDRPRRDQRDGNRGRGGGRGGRGRGGGGRRGGRGRGDRNFNNPRKGGRKKDDDSSSSRSINMNALEGAGFVHLYGLSSVLNALATGRRDLSTSMEKSDLNDSRFDDLDGSRGGWDDDDDDDDFGAPRRSSRKETTVKPEAQFRPYLFVQERNRSGGSERRGSKASAAQEVMKLAEEREVPIAYVDKGTLNVLSGNRPHQGFALRCGKLFFESLSRIPLPTNARSGGDLTATPSSPTLWLVLDEVVDPQNLGALLRSAYFLGGKKKNNKIGVLVCSKNSAPPSPVVSASSAGALEVVDVYSTSNLPRTLNQSREDGFRIIGASISVPSTNNDDDPPPLYDLQDLPVCDADGDNRPILLVLGSEGHGLRTLVAKACTEFVCIPSGMGGVEPMDEDDSGSEAGVDSLNVSVSAGIMLWHLLHGGK
mmetsp:Transcript_7389/g.21497  ORF Transcript_7389/g.21497 Transcript_7389/m.21497 type:complete len:612 (+) Transcript_7389:230-2065(+)